MSVQEPARGQAVPATQRAVLQENYGGTEVLRYATIPVPALKDSEVLVRVHAAGLDRGVWHLMTGRPYLLRLAFGLKRPRVTVPGRELAGTVAAIGAAVTRFRPGDEVFGTGNGAFAQYAAAPEDKLAPKPERISFAQAAVCPVSGLTALGALLDAGRVRSGQQVLILGASGGVGSFAVQLAKALGAEVTGACSPAKAGFVRELGADHVLDYTSGDFLAGPQRYDAVIVLGGDPSLSRLRHLLTPRGTAVLVGGEEGNRITGGMMERQVGAMAQSLFIRKRLTGYLGRENSGLLQRFSGFLERGDVVPAVGGTFPLEQMARAMDQLAAGRISGKAAVVP